MARTVNEQEYETKRNEILDVARRLVYSKGYERMTISDILHELKISKGAFYHYFASKQAVLEGLLDRVQREGEQVLDPIMNDPELPALAKLQRFFDTAGRWKTAQKPYLLQLIRVWNIDENAIVRQRVQASMSRHTAPLLTQVIHQGMREGTLAAAFPDEAGAIVVALVFGLGEAFTELLLKPSPGALQCAKRIAAAYNDALERVLGAPSGSLQLLDSATLREWFAVAGGEPLETVAGRG